MTATLPTLAGSTNLATPTITIGTDIASVARVRALLAASDAFATTVFRPDEIAYCTGFRDPAPHFAARFSAKEATLKALHLELGLPPATSRLRDIEVCRRSGAPWLRLHDRLARRIERLGIAGAAVSLSHDGDYAVAYVLVTWLPGVATAPSQWEIESGQLDMAPGQSSTAPRQSDTAPSPMNGWRP